MEDRMCEVCKLWATCLTGQACLTADDVTDCCTADLHTKL